MTGDHACSGAVLRAPDNAREMKSAAETTCGCWQLLSTQTCPCVLLPATVPSTTRTCGHQCLEACPAKRPCDWCCACPSSSVLHWRKEHGHHLMTLSGSQSMAQLRSSQDDLQTCGRIRRSSLPPMRWRFLLAPCLPMGLPLHEPAADMEGNSGQVHVLRPGSCVIAASEHLGMRLKQQVVVTTQTLTDAQAEPLPIL